jgi:hypothetical protein
MSVQSPGAAARYPAPSIQSRGRPFTIAAFICAALALLFGLLAGIPGVVLGIVGHVKGDRPLAAWSIAASVVAAVISMIIAAALLSSSEDTTGILLASLA